LDTAADAAPPDSSPVDTITRRARTTVADYRVREDNPWFTSLVAIGFLFLAMCGYFALPWATAPTLRGSPGLVEFVHFAVAWGAVPIFLLAFRAVYQARAALADLGVNLAIAQHVERSAAAKLQLIRQDPSIRGTVHNLESEHLPDNPGNPKPAALRLFRRICAEAQDRRFESTINLIEPYQRESMEPVLRLEGVQRSALRWGILCHFIGLVLVINAVPAMLVNNPAAVGTPAQAIAAPGSPAEGVTTSNEEGSLAIVEILDGLRLAFGASVAGLAVSLFASMLLSMVRRKQFAYFRQLDEATATMISLASNSLNNDELMSSLQHVSTRLQEQTLVVKEGIGALSKTISSQADTIKGGLSSLADAKTQLDEFLKGIATSHETFLTKLKNLHDIGAAKDLVEGVARQLEASQVRATNELKSEINDVRTGLANMERLTSLHMGEAFRYLPHALVFLLATTAITLLVVWSRG